MFKVIKAFLFVLIIILCRYNIYAQFDSLIFSKAVNLNYNYTDIYQLGDQNSDGFDDLLIYDCANEKAMVFLGGSPMDTIPALEISANRVSIAAIDLNDDDIKDIVIVDRTNSTNRPIIIKLFYGGSLLDTIPDIQFYPTLGAIGAVPYVLKDFNGDGRSELVMYDANLPFSSKQYGTLYFYNTESQFDTIPHYVMMGDSVNKIKIGPIEPGDLNGDGKADFMIYGRVGDPPLHRNYISFYLGNESLDFTPAQTFYKDEHTFELEGWKIISDINGDGKDDILIYDYGFYPYYYRNAILHGSFPVDTIPDAGLNSQNISLSPYATFSLGDVNGDGYNDFFSKDAAAYPNVKLWVGGREMPYTSDDQANKTWFGTSGGFGRVISNVGDVDGDSVNDFSICEIPYGVPYDCKMSLVYIFRGDTSVIGDTGTVTVGEIDIVPDRYCLYDPYPNPFNPVTTIKYDLPIASDVSLIVYDILGRKVKELVNTKRQAAGRHEIQFNASSVASGVYIYQLIADNPLTSSGQGYISSKKMILLK